MRQRIRLPVDSVHGFLDIRDALLEVEPAGLNGLEALAKEFRGTDQSLEVNTAVFHRKALVIQQQLLFTIKDDVLGIQLVDLLLQFVAFDLQPVALLGGAGAAQRVGVVPVRDAEHLKGTVPGKANLRRIDGGIESLENDGGQSRREIHFRDAFDLGALLVDDYVVNLGGYGNFFGSGW